MNFILCVFKSIRKRQSIVWDKEKRYKQAVYKSECLSGQYSYENVFSFSDHQWKKWKMKEELTCSKRKIPLAVSELVMDWMSPPDSRAEGVTPVWIFGDRAFRDIIKVKRDFPSGSDGKEPAYNAGGPSLIPGSERPTGEEKGNPLQYSCLENSMGRGAWWATVHGIAKSQTRLSN